MRTKTKITTLFICLSAYLSGQTLTVPSATPVNINGTIDSLEWSDADTVLINHSSTVQTKVLFKHDDTSLHVAFVDNLQSAGLHFPEILVDAANDQSLTFQPDDWWFHVSATDCEYQGQYGNYDSCMTVRPNWLAAPNFIPMTGPTINKVEIKIPFNTIGVKVGDTIGLCFVLNNFQTFRYFPSMADHLNPSTWHTSVIKPSIITGLKEEGSTKDFKLFPNPVSESLTLKGIDPNSNSYIEIFDMNGKLRFQGNYSQIKSLNIEVKNWKPGIYIIAYQSGKNIIRKKIMVQ